MKQFMMSMISRIIPVSARQWILDRSRAQAMPLLGSVKFGHLYRLRPFSYHFGYERGQPVDRYYIENFLQCFSTDIQGRVLEVGNRSYTRRFGGDRVKISEVLDIRADNPNATIIDDLSVGKHIASDTYDCIILTQTLHFIYEARLAVHTLYRILKPGGVVLVTVPGISQIGKDRWEGTWYWSFNTQSAERMFAEVFPSANISVKAYGNVLTATSFLYGIVSQELDSNVLNSHDPYYQLLITVRAVKPALHN